jgi:hypothetical protein
MPNLDISMFAPSMTLLVPLAGIGRSFRPDTTRCPSSVAPAGAVVPTSRDGLSMRWRVDSQGALVMEWTA